MCACVRNVTERILSQMGPILSAVFFFLLPWPSIPCDRLGLLVIEASLSQPDTPHLMGLLWISDQPQPDEASRSHSLDTPHLVGFLWMSDQPYIETSSLQHTTLTRDSSMPPGGIQNHNPSKRSVDPHGRWGRLSKYYIQ